MTVACVVLGIGGVLKVRPETDWMRRWDERRRLPSGTVGELMRHLGRHANLGHVDERDVASEAARVLNLTDVHQVEAFMADFWADCMGSPNEELIDHVRGLRGRCRLGILSNSPFGAGERYAALYHFDELVERIVYSYEIGTLKPDPRAFAAVCARLEVEPESCLFVDDTAAHVEAARAVGMQAHLFEGNAGTIARIAAHLDAGPVTPAGVTLG